MFKLTDTGLLAVKKLKQVDEFDLFLAELRHSLAALDKSNRSLLETNTLLKSTGKALQIQYILDSVEAV